jgi:hypothetical protein
MAFSQFFSRSHLDFRDGNRVCTAAAGQPLTIHRCMVREGLSQQQQHASFLTCCQRIFFEVDETQLVSCLKKKKGHGHGQKHIEK